MSKRMKSVIVYTCDNCGNDEFQTRETAEVNGPPAGLHIRSLTWVTYNGDRTATKFYICQDCIDTQAIDLESVLLETTSLVVAKEDAPEDDESETDEDDESN